MKLQNLPVNFLNNRNNAPLMFYIVLLSLFLQHLSYHISTISLGVQQTFGKIMKRSDLTCSTNDYLIEIVESLCFETLFVNLIF